MSRDTIQLYLLFASLVGFGFFCSCGGFEIQAECRGLSVSIEGELNSSNAPSQQLIESTAKKLHDRFQAIRKSEYGNVHFMATFNSEASNGYLQRRKIRFWSRNDSMFRIDEEIIASSNKAEVGLKTRIIVRPEGFVQMKNTDKGFAITNFGSEIAGREKIEVSSLYAASTRTYSIMNAEAVFGPVNGMEYTNEYSKKIADTYQVLDIQENGATAIVTTQSRHNLSGKETWTIRKATFDTEHGVIMSYAITETKIGDQQDEFHCTKEYSFAEFGNIPKSISLVDNRKGIKSRETLVIDSLDSSPVPIGIFALGIKSLGEEPSIGPWTTRLFIAGIGLVAIVLYVFYVHRSRS